LLGFEAGEVKCLGMKMGHKMADEFSGFCMQSFSLYHPLSRVILRASGADHTWFSSAYLHDCIPWGGGLSPPHVPPTHKFKERLINL